MVTEIARWTVVSLTILSVLLCVVCYRWRFLIHSFLYLECIIRLSASFIPNVYNEAHSNIDLVMLSTIFFLCFSTDGIGQVAFNTLCWAFAAFFDVHVVYEKELNFEFFIMNIFLIVSLFTAQLVAFLFFTYVQTLHGKLEFTNFENIKLLDGMHEGLLIVNKGESVSHEANSPRQRYSADRFVSFCNRPANKLFTDYLGQSLIISDNNCDKELQS